MFFSLKNIFFEKVADEFPIDPILHFLLHLSFAFVLSSLQ